ncbi:MAG: type I-C CRISPR-associated endonuclease Cas1c [Clostridia bacterium]|nr:type I-C CRISPR-associated endonuclease Cas1c [Clostridia bacterium]
MRRLLNTLFVTSENAYLTLDGENVVVKNGNVELARFPLHNFEGVISFSYAGASPALMGALAKRGINLSFCTPNGGFLARTTANSNGNVLLRRKQYRIADDEAQSCEIARNMIFAKVHNCRWSVDRTARDHGMRVDVDRIFAAGQRLSGMLPMIKYASTLDSLRGMEGEAATVYFGVFNEMILSNKEAFFYKGRSRRPPLDKLNALLSFAYAMLSRDCSSALESVGLDPYVGFLHTDRPGRVSLALDLMEEFRPCMADRFVLTLINNRIIKAQDFSDEAGGAVNMTDEGRKRFLSEWQERKRELITHPYLKEKIPWGLAPHMQALLLARFIRGDMDGYPPFLWK